jgi:hypothetical protein
MLGIGRFIAALNMERRLPHPLADDLIIPEIDPSISADRKNGRNYRTTL